MTTMFMIPLWPFAIFFLVLIFMRRAAKVAVSMVVVASLLPVLLVLGGVLFGLLAADRPTMMTMAPPRFAMPHAPVATPDQAGCKSPVMEMIMAGAKKPARNTLAANTAAKPKKGDRKNKSSAAANAAPTEKTPAPAENKPIQAEKETLRGEKDPESTAVVQETSKPSADRPSWAGAEPFKDGAVYKWPVTLDPRATKSEAEEELLPAAANAVIAEYARKKLKLDITPYQQSSGGWPYLPEEYVRGQMIGGDVWAEPVNVSFGRWIRLHALLKFDRQTNERLRERWKDGETVRRLANVGVLGTCLLLALATAWAYLKADLATAGRYRWRLRLAATSLIAALMILGMSVT